MFKITENSPETETKNMKRKVANNVQHTCIMASPYTSCASKIFMANGYTHYCEAGRGPHVQK